jgi:hypothetical protein
MDQAVDATLLIHADGDLLPGKDGSEDHTSKLVKCESHFKL